MQNLSTQVVHLLPVARLLKLLEGIALFIGVGFFPFNYHPCIIIAAPPNKWLSLYFQGLNGSSWSVHARIALVLVE